MIKSLVEILGSYTEAFRELVNMRIWSGSNSIKELLRLNNDADWSFICTAMDIIGDTSRAIDNFLQFDLDGPTRYKDQGEQYLRLYGVLNATYLQQQAVHKLYTLMHVPDPKLAEKEIEALDIKRIRHQIGAHSTNYKNRVTGRFESYLPIRMSLSGFNCEYINNDNMAIESVNLKDCLKKHLALMVELLDRTYEKAGKTLCKSNKEKTLEHSKKLQDLRIIKNGGVVMEMGGTKLIIRTSKHKF